ncbi:hypothetical protein AMJ80_02585 [bacterium SM23_31]|nr:MAG: hypothetical protein AMJ80_02585 [bacterium SM23_31]
MMKLKTKYLKTLSEEDISKKLLYILLITVSLYFIYFFAFSEIRKIIAVVPDDAYYFFKIAENVAHGKGLSFDGINKTNGFQPLWLYVLIPIYLIYSGSPETMLRIILIFQVGLITGAALIIYRVHADFFSRKISLISGIGYIMVVFVPSTNGMESALLILMLSLLFAYGWKGKVFSRHSPKRGLFFGIVLGLVMLARLDTVFLGAAISAFCVIQIAREPLKRRDHLIRLILIITGASLIVSPYLLFNYLEFGSIMPISGALKSSFPKISLSRDIINFFAKRYLLFAILAFVYFLWKIVSLKKFYNSANETRYYEICMLVLSTAIVLHFAHTVIFMKWAVFGWHFIPYALFITLAISEIIAFFLSSNWKIIFNYIYWFGIIVIIFAGGFIIYKRNYRPLDKISSWSVSSYNAAVWTRENTNKSDIIAMIDAGIFGYFSQRSVINLDGIVNTMKYQEILKNKKLNKYFKENKVTYFVQFVFKDYHNAFYNNYDTFSKTVPSHKYMIESDEIILHEHDEIYRSPPFDYFQYRSIFLMWKLSIN